MRDSVRTTSLISRVSDAGQCEDVGFPGVQITNDVHTNFLHWRVQVHHLVCNSQLVHKFLHTNQLTVQLTLFTTFSLNEQYIIVENIIIQFFTDFMLLFRCQEWNNYGSSYLRDTW